MAGHCDQNIARTLQAVLELRVCRQPGWEADAGQVSYVFAFGCHGFEFVELEQAAQFDVTTRARKLHSQRGAPGAGPDNGNSCWGIVAN